jgi:hypothetical protein
MRISKSTVLVFAIVVLVMMLSVTVFKSESGSAKSTQENVSTIRSLSHDDLVKRYPTADFDEPLSPDPAKRAALKQRQIRNNDISFGQPGPQDEAVAYIPEGRFGFPGLPVNESDTIVVGLVSSSRAHRSESRQSVFSEFEVRVDEVLKGQSGSVTESSVITVERAGGFLKYPGGRKVLFFIPGYGMPEVGTRNLFFLKNVNEGLRIVTIYELTPNGVLALDQSKQFKEFQGEKEETFLATLRKTIAASNPQ